MLLLDTCTFLWLTSNPKSLSEETRQLIVRYREDLYLSSISAFEIGVKSAKGQLILPQSAGEWFLKSLQHHGITEIPIDSGIALLSTELPPLHRDPCDRMIIATSQIHKMILLTPDPLIRRYPQARTVW
jgi:PIN domain nuclease of toxin-antitoxin system